MATNTEKAKANGAPPRVRSSRSRSKKPAGAIAVDANARSQQERRLLHWVYGNSETILLGLSIQATHAGESRQNIEMNRCLNLAVEFGRLARVGDTSGIPANFTQQRSETQSGQVALGAGGSG